MPKEWFEMPHKEWMEQFPNALFLCDTSGQLNYSNPAFRGLLQLSAAECMAYGWQKHADKPQQLAEQWQQAILAKSSFVLDFHHAFAKLRYLRIRATPLNNKQQELIGYIGSLEGISEPLDYAVIHASPIPTALFDQQGQPQYINPALSHSLGYQGTDLAQFAQSWQQAIQVAQPSANDSAFTLKIKAKEAGMSSFRVHATALEPAQGKLYALIDMTEFEQQSRESKEQIQRYRQLFDKAELSIWNQDMTALLTHLAALRESGIRDLSAYLDEFPAALNNMISMFRVIDINPATLTLFGGTSKTEFISGFSSLFGENAFNVLRQELLAFWHGDRIFRSEIHLKTLQGKPIQALISYPIPTTQEEARIVPVSIQDISELKASESRWQFAIEGSGDGLWDWDIASNHVFYSRRWKEMLGFSEEEIGNDYQEWQSRVHQDDLARVTRNIEQHLQGETPFYHHEYRIRNKEGQWQWVIDRGMIVARDAQGLPARAIGTLHDITQRKNNENVLSAQRAQLAGMIDSAMDAIITTDANFNIILFNQAAENMFGYPAGTMLGSPLEALIPDKLASRHRELMQKFASQGEGHRKMGGNLARQVMGKRADGNEFPIEVAISYLENLGKPIYTAMVRNITERMAYETSLLQLANTLELRVIERTQELETAKQQAENANKAKSAFLANMSHEIRTPLNSVLGMTHLAQLTSLSPKQSDYLKKITLSANHLLDLINDILDFSKIEAGKLEIGMHDFSLSELIHEVRELIQQKVEEKGLQLTIIMGIEVPLYFKGDDLRIKQVLINLLSNAIKFTEDGKITLEIKHLDNKNIGFSVKDTGIGIPLEAQAQLFQSFQQADNSITRKFGGTGLGLAISSQLVQLMGGELTLQSQLGLGSEFSFSLNLPQIQQPPAVAPRLKQDIEQKFLAGKRILLADDHPFNQQIGAELLQIAGADVVIACNGLEAIQKAGEVQLDAILLDVQMPIMDGISACRELRSNPSLSHIPILAMTANVSRDYMQNCIDAGMNDFISKPVQANTLYQKLTYWLSQPIQSSQTPASAAVAEPSSSAIQNAAPIDFAQLQDMLGDNPDRQKKYCAKFAESFEEGLSLIRSQHESNIPIGPECHRLKSIAHTIGAMQLGQQLNKMEQQSEQWSQDERMVQIATLQQLYQQACGSLQAAQLLETKVEPPPPAATISHQSTLFVMLVDDDPFMLEIIEQHLNDSGISQVLRFINAKAALDRLAQLPQPDWVFCDLQMPDMDGVAFLRQLGQLKYEGYIAILSAMDKQVLKAAELLANSFHLKLGGTLTKPIKQEQIAQMLLKNPVKNSLLHNQGEQPALQMLEEELRQGLENGEVELYFQPKVTIHDRKVLGAESLARWRHPQRGLLGPQLFVPAMESLGLIDELTLCVLKLASKQLRQWQEQGTHLKLSINVSMGNLHRLELPDLFNQVLQENNISPEMITLEITETQLSHDYVLSLDILTRLRIMGFGLSVDDFGTGFSTMEHLIQIPFTELKIDKAFVSGATLDPSARTILEHSINLGQKFELNLVAEGVETQADWDLVAQMGCHEVQGYLIGHPMPADEFLHWKDRWEIDLSKTSQAETKP